MTIDERIALLEIQVTDLDQDVNFLFDEQVIQDERVFSVEEEIDVIDTRLLLIDNELEGESFDFKYFTLVFTLDVFAYFLQTFTTELQDTTLVLDF